MPIKKHDFVEVDYTGRLKDTNEVFDTTDEKTAKDANVYTDKGVYKPVIICVGEHHILKGIDEFLEGKEAGKFKIEIASDKAFGKKDASLLKMIPISKFEEQKIKPVAGLRLNIDGNVGMIKSVSSGRTVVDFNHPLAGHDVLYEIKVNKIVTDKKVQVESVLRVLLGIRTNVEVRDKKAKIDIPALPPQIQAELAKKLTELTGLDIELMTKDKPQEAKNVDKK